MMNAEKEGFRTVGMEDRKHLGQEVFRTGRIQDRFEIQVRYDAGK